MPRRYALFLIVSALALPGCKIVEEMIFGNREDNLNESRNEQHAAVNSATGWGASERNQFEAAEAHQQIDCYYDSEIRAERER